MKNCSEAWMRARGHAAADFAQARSERNPTATRCSTTRVKRCIKRLEFDNTAHRTGAKPAKDDGGHCALHVADG